MDATVAASFADSADLDRARIADRQGIGGEARLSAAVGAGFPAQLSEVIMHRLEKEPDNRYQTADGLLRDLERLSDDAPGAGAIGLLAPVDGGQQIVHLRRRPAAGGRAGIYYSD